MRFSRSPRFFLEWDLWRRGEELLLERRVTGGCSVNTRTQPGSSGDRVRLRIYLSPGASGVNGESGALDVKL